MLNVNKEDMALYAVTDRSWLKSGETLAMQVESAIKGGATFIQLREKNMALDDFIEEGKVIKEITDRYKVPFVINDNIEVAIAINADGVHIGQGDEELLAARKRLGDNKIIGISAHNAKEAIIAEKNGADYLGVGAVFSTSTKEDAETISHETIKDISLSVNLPIVAIGGISKDNILKLKGTGADGVAVISAIFAKENIEEASRELLKLSKEMSGK